MFHVPVYHKKCISTSNKSWLIDQYHIENIQSHSNKEKIRELHVIYTKLYGRLEDEDDYATKLAKKYIEIYNEIMESLN